MRRDINSIAGTTKLAALASMGLASMTLAQPAFYLMGNVGPTTYSNVTGLSYDGKVACGYHNGPVGGSFTWTPTGGRVDTPQTAIFVGISGDGAIVTGTKTNPGSGRLELLRHTVATGIDEYLGLPAGYDNAIGEAISQGGVIVGNAGWGGTKGYQSPIRWTPSDGLKVLTGPDLGDHSQAYGVSADGKTVVGNANDTGLGMQSAFIWREGVGQSRLPGGFSAHAITPDASVVVGSGSVGSSFGAVRWVNGVGERLGSVPGWSSEAIDVSDNGNVVIGILRKGAADQDCFVWTHQTGMMMAKDYFLSMGIPLPSDTNAIRLATVSGDALSFGGLLSAPSRPDSGGAVFVVPSVPTFGMFAIAGLAMFRRQR